MQPICVNIIQQRDTVNISKIAESLELKIDSYFGYLCSANRWVHIFIPFSCINVSAELYVRGIQIVQ